LTVIAYHLIWTNYGTWLANDPRGSRSHRVYTPELAEFGAAHFGRRKVQPSRKTVHEFYTEAEPRLQFPALRFDAAQRQAVGNAFEEIVRKCTYTCYACAIMPDHVHLVIRKHRDSAEQIIGNLQGMSRAWLLKCDLAPEEHPVWTKNGWRVFLSTPAEVWSRIRYIENNPEKEGLSRQAWPFVVPYDNWPFHKRRS
jgi:REP-associated tyrosine transposase